MPTEEKVLLKSDPAIPLFPVPENSGFRISEMVVQQETKDLHPVEKYQTYMFLYSKWHARRAREVRGHDRVL